MRPLRALLMLCRRHLDLVVIVSLVALYASSFRATSPVYGPTEVFYQDTPHIIDCLEHHRRYLWNPQHHLLYHVVVEGLVDGLQAIPVVGARCTIYRVLKTFTVLTGLAALLALRALLAELGLRTWQRALLILLAGVSIAAWFNFTVFETHSIAVPAVILHLLLVARLIREHRLSRRGWALLAGTMAFAILCRMEYVRLLPVTAGLAFLPALDGQRRRLLLAVVLAAVLGAVTLSVMAHGYFGVDWRHAPTTIVQREDRPSLHGKLMVIGNLTSPMLVKRMLRAGSIFVYVMPTTGQRFRDYPSEMLADWRTWPAMVSIHVLLVWSLIGTLRRVRRGATFVAFFVAVVVAHWLSGFVLYTWFNPHEPFLWVLEFLPVLVVLTALAFADRGRRAWLFVALTTAVVFAHNAGFFYARYR